MSFEFGLPFIILLISQRNITVPCPVHTCCRLKWNTGWWENVCNIYSEVRFKKTFRVSQVAYNFILNNIEPSLIQQIVMKEVILPALRLAICLYRLDRGEYLNTIVEIAFLSTGLIWEICLLIIAFTFQKVKFCCHFLLKTWLTICYHTACFPHATFSLFPNREHSIQK